MRFFCTAGPVRSEDHYCLSPLTRLALSEVLALIDQQKYFVRALLRSLLQGHRRPRPRSAHYRCNDGDS